MVGINEGVDGFADVVDDPLPIDDVNAIGEAGRVPWSWLAAWWAVMRAIRCSMCSSFRVGVGMVWEVRGLSWWMKREA